ncbi:hypothetical protein [Luteolibacter pohnpeiensis]|nr:hypothetical protein [Luteolibacter pohnpeiensis]
MPEPDPYNTGRAYRPSAYRRRPILRMLIPIFGILILAAIVSGLCMFLMHRKTDPLPLTNAEDLQPTSPPKASPPPEELSSIGGDAPSAPETPDALPAPKESPDFAQVAKQAGEVLNQFLNAQSLEERLPLIETKADPTTLQDTVLAKPMPPVQRSVVEMQQPPDPIENLIDTYFSVAFRTENNGTDQQLILVRTRQSANPKVVVEPFLDLYGGRLKQFCETPVSKAETFEVVASALANCYNEAVPNREKKMAIKLMAHDNTRPIAEAYFSSKHSQIADLLSDDLSGFRYGQAQPCTILLRWNTEEDPEKPFIEALDISALNWNP